MCDFFSAMICIINNSYRNIQMFAAPVFYNGETVEASE